MMTATKTKNASQGGQHATHPDDSAVLLGLLCAVPTLAGAQGWAPTRPIKLICPFPAGGGTDQIARIVAKGLTDRLGQQVYVENRGGANGGLGAQEVMRAEPDGYTIGAISDSPMTVNPWMYDKLAYSPLQDFIAVARINHFPSLLVAHPSVPDQDRRRPDQAREGEARHAELFLRRRRQLQPSRPGGAGVQDRHQHRARALPRRRPATQAVLAGDVQLMYNNIATALPHVEAGKLTGLAVGGEQRFPALPNVPTVAETVPGFDVTPWVGMFVPAKTPKEIVARLSKEVDALLKDPEVVKIFQTSMIKASYLDSEPFAKQIKKETDDWEKVIKALGIKAE